jgi:hypothetical protein
MDSNVNFEDPSQNQLMNKIMYVSITDSTKQMFNSSLAFKEL